MDDSPRDDAQDETKAVLQALQHRLGAGIRYAGRRERSRFAETLARESGVPLEIVRFGLLGDARCPLSTGANRNSLLIDTLDSLVLSVDDDTRCRIGDPPDREDPVTAFAGYDPTEFWFFPDRASALESVSFVDDDVLGRHEALLGQDAGGGRVAITLSGLVGDSGMTSPRYYLALAGASRERLVASESAYRSAFRSREVLRSVRRPTVAAGSFCMTTFFGFDNRGVLPPFFPVQRNSDGVFGVGLHKCLEGSRTAFLPCVLEHVPSESRAFAPDAIWADADSTRMADVVISCVLSYQGTAQIDNSTRLAGLGRHLQAVGSLPPADFEAYVRGMQRFRTMAFVTTLQAQLQRCGASPRFWADDVERMIERLSNAGTEKDRIVPRDLTERLNLDDARQLSQELIGKFGELIDAWPAITAAARRLRARGCRLTDVSFFV